MIFAQPLPLLRDRVRFAILICNAVQEAGADPDYKKLFAKRKPHIDKFHSEIKKELSFAKSDTLRKLRRSHLPSDLPAPNSELLASAASSGAGAAFLFDASDLDAGLRAIISDANDEMLPEAGQDVFDELGRDDVFTVPPKAAKDFIAHRQNLMTNVSDEVFQSIKDEIQQGLDAGESLRKIEKRIESKFEEIDQGRAAVVASTEVAAAYGFARDKALRQSGVTHKKWLNSGLPNVRPAHRAAHGQIVSANKPFRVGGENLMYPGDVAGSPGNTINCHCIAIAAENP